MPDLQPHQERVVAERAELAQCIAALSQFTLGGKFAGLPEAEQRLLTRQESAMTVYLFLLDERLALWGA